MIRAIVVLSCVGVGGIVALEYLHPTDNNMSAITIIIGFLTPTIVGMLGLMKGQENAQAIEQLHANANNQYTNTTNQLCQITDAATVAAVKANEAAVKTDKIVEVTNKTAQNVEAIKKNGH